VVYEIENILGYKDEINVKVGPDVPPLEGDLVSEGFMSSNWSTVRPLSGYLERKNQQQNFFSLSIKFNQQIFQPSEIGK